jgi:hypothetical protein
MRRRALLVLIAAALCAPAAVATAAPKYPDVFVPSDAARPKMRASILSVNRWWVRTHRFVPCGGCMVRPPGSQILWTYYRGQGFYPNWVRAARDVLRHKIRGDEARLRAGAREILSAATVRHLPNGLRYRVMQSAYRAPDGQRPPWRDAMGNGLVLTLAIPAIPAAPTPQDMARAHREAREFLNSFAVHWTAGGLMEKGAGRGRWYLEYAYRTGARSRVLNGFMQSLVSLDRFARQAELLAPNDPAWIALRDRARDYVDRGVVELVRMLPRYDLGPGVSKYSLTRPGPAPAKYHTYHLQLLSRLEAMTYLPASSRAVITRYRQRWGGSPLGVNALADPLPLPPG